MVALTENKRFFKLTLPNKMSFDLGNARKIRDSNVEITTQTVSQEEEDDDHDDQESYSIRSSDSEFY